MEEKTSLQINRRKFLKGVSTATLAGALGKAEGAAGRESAEAREMSASASDYYVRRGDRLRAVAMPLGGIGTGSIALAGDGGLRQWQVVHNVNHLAHVPHSFFAVWAKAEGEKGTARLLQSSAWYDQSGFRAPPTSNDHVVPEASRTLLEQFPGVKEIEFTGRYPVAEINYLDPTLPVSVALEAYSPFVPHDAKNSGLPAIVFEFTVKNPGPAKLDAAVLASLQNFIGWDGQSGIRGVEFLAYGDNANELVSRPGLVAVTMSNRRLPADFAFNGTLTLAALDPSATATAQWDNLDSLWRDFSEDGALETDKDSGPSAEGRTWNGALAVRIQLEPGAEKRITFLLAWHFPNRYVNWDQPAFTIPDRKTKFWVGVRYATWFKSALEVVEYVRDHFQELSSETRLWRDTLYDSTLPPELIDSAGSQASIIRTPTCIWTEDGNFHGFEGCCGASTGHCGESGCCPLNCTHVWNYEQALARLFPDLERTMRHTDLAIQQAPEGYIPHRTILPFYLPRAWNRKIGGPENPALDGMLGTVLKTYREYRLGGGKEWLEPLWPSIKRLMEYVMTNLDPEGQGVIRGEQPTTYDTSIYGANAFIGSLYLAALGAAERMARVVGEEDSAERYRRTLEKGRVNLPAECWSGEYYVQKVDLAAHPKYEFASGCFSDQLIGQWWAHQLDLGYVLPEEQVKKAVAAVFRHNWRHNFRDFKQAPRKFASDDDAGLLIASWPNGGRPAEPTLYVDEVWTGVEYEVAALLIWEGMAEEALELLRGVRARYDGRQRSPWNDIECGDHYARAMSSWSLLEAASGLRSNEAEGYLAFAPRLMAERFVAPFLIARAYGRFEQQVTDAAQQNSIRVVRGEVPLRRLDLGLAPGTRRTRARATLDGKPFEGKWTLEGGVARFEPISPIELRAPATLSVECA